LSRIILRVHPDVRLHAEVASRPEEFRLQPLTDPPGAQDMTSRRVKSKTGVDEAEKRRNQTKAKVRAKVEWPFRILKRVFGFTKVRYRGLKKNHEWLCAGFALANIYQHRRRLARINLRTALSGHSVSGGGQMSFRRTK